MPITSKQNSDENTIDFHDVQNGNQNGEPSEKRSYLPEVFNIFRINEDLNSCDWLGVT